MDVAASRGDVPDGGDDVGVGGLFEHVSGGSGREGLTDVAGVVLHREDEDACLRAVGEEIRDGIDAAPTRHDDIHQDDVGLLGPRLEDCAARIGGLADDLQAGFGFEHMT